jgi:hypothetical protein
MQTGENEQGLRKILDLTRGLSLSILLLHFYYLFYQYFLSKGYASDLSDRLISNILDTGLFTGFHRAKLICIGLLMISLIGVKGRKNEKLNYKTAVLYMLSGTFLYFSSYFVFYVQTTPSALTGLYISVTTVGYILMLTGGTIVSRIIKVNLNSDIFNKANESFPQEERILDNEYSINLPSEYILKGKKRKSWINIINPFRGLLVMGSPGSGKSYFVIQHIIRQHLQKGFSMFVYDFKYDDLTRIAYNEYLKHRDSFPTPPQFYNLNFDDLSRSARCNPLDPSTLFDLTDVAESARTIMLGLNREWIKKQGDFFVESPINFVTAIIWFLRKYANGKYCSLPHVIELIQVPYEKLFSVLRTEPQIEVLINPFVTAYLNDAMEQLEGQIASAKISLARLSSPHLYYILTGNDFTLDINNPQAPKIVCIGNNPQKTQTYGAVLSLFVSAMIRMVNKKGKLKSSLIFDEFPTIFFNGMDTLIATARSNKVAATIAIQDASQLVFNYGKEQAEVIMNITGNVISGQVTGSTAKTLSERFGKIMQDRESVSINRQDTSISRSKQLDMAIPLSTISSLSSGEFVGMVADNPEDPISLKTFCNRIVNDHMQLKHESDKYKDMPVLNTISDDTVHQNYLKVKEDINLLIDTEIERIMNTPELEMIMVRKG